MTDLVEIDLLWNAVRYNETDPLFQRLRERGLDDPAARDFVAALAGGKSGRGRGHHIATRAMDARNDNVRALISNRMGLLQHESKAEGAAFAEVEKTLSRKGISLSDKQLRRIWAGRRQSLLLELAMECGKRGVELDI